LFRFLIGFGCWGGGGGGGGARGAVVGSREAAKENGARRSREQGAGSREQGAGEAGEAGLRWC
jgi:hypothetical protein